MNGGWRAFALWWVAASALFLLLPQMTPHGMDTHFFVVWLEEGHQEYARHPLYMQLARWTYELLAPFGCSPYRALLVLSAVASGFGIGCVAAAAPRLLGDGVRRPWLLPAALLLVPSLHYYATAAEIGGVSTGAFGLAWLAFAHWRADARDGLARAMLVGVTTGVAAGVHAFGHLLVPLFVLARWRLDGLSMVELLRTRWFTRWLALALAHAAVAVLAAVVAGVGARGQANDAWGHLVERWLTLDPMTTPVVTWREWLLPYAPWSFAALCAVAIVRSRAWAQVALAGILLHLPLTVLLVGSIHADEDGMYHLALAVPAVVAALQWANGSMQALLCAGGLALTLWFVAPSWAMPGTPEFGQGLAQLRGEGEFTLVANEKERDAARVRVQHLVILELDRMLGFYDLARQQGLSVEQWASAMLAQFARPERPLLLTARCAQVMQHLAPPLDGLWAVLEQRAQIEPVQRAGFTGVFVRPK